MTFDQYVAYVGTPENLAREAGWWLGPRRQDFSGLLRARYARAQLSEAQVAAIRWLAAQSGGAGKVLVISEEWSSDRRRDVPMLARLAEAIGLELRIFPRDGQELGRGPRADPGESPNADIVSELLTSAGVLTARPRLAQDGRRLHDHRHGAGSDHAVGDCSGTWAAHPRASGRDRGRAPASARARPGNRQRSPLQGRPARGRRGTGRRHPHDPARHRGGPRADGSTGWCLAMGINTLRQSAQFAPEVR